MEEELKKHGLLPRYQITKSNGKPIDSKAMYFVLRYDNDGSDQTHIKACQKALAVYAEEIKGHLPALSKELKKILKDLTNNNQ